MIGVGADVIRAFGKVVLATAALSLFIAPSHALHERAYDIAVLRTFGARPSTIAAMLILEALMLAILGGAAGLVLAHGVVALLAWWTASQDSLTVSASAFSLRELWLLGPALLAGALPRSSRLARGKGGHFRDARAPPLNRE
jgi:putative ABC transport system permease protein